MLKFFASVLVALLSAVLCAQTDNLIVILIAAAIGFAIAFAILSLYHTGVCPYCSERIKSTAIVCHFCGRSLTSSQT